MTDEKVNESEIVERRDAALKRALATPPMPHVARKAESKKTAAKARKK